MADEAFSIPKFSIFNSTTINSTMAYQSRKRTYTSRRERLQRHLRNYRVSLIFALLALIVLIIKTRGEIWGWLRTYFY